MTVDDLALAAAAHDAAEDRLLGYASTAGVDVRRGAGWAAVRTGADSNDMNGVVSQDGAEISPELIRDLMAWFGSVPASWLARRPSARLTRTLLEAGALAERSGRWSGRLLDGTRFDSRAAVEISRVRSVDDLDHWLDLTAACGWVSSDQDRSARRQLYLGLGWDDALTQWLALDGPTPVGFASSYLHGHVLDLCNLGVLPARRRQGIGRALVAARLAAAAGRGATLLVSAPSPDGWRLQRTLGFRSVPVVADRCFYLPLG